MKDGTQKEFRFASRIGLLILFLFTTGCQAEAALGASQQMWMWLAIPLAGLLLIGAFFVWLRRRSQLLGWRVDHGEPSVKRIVIGVVIAATIPAVIFVIENLRIEIDPSQRMWNIGLWLIGSIVGATAALLIGLRSAEPR